ncbi:MAG TPA: hypothetical protein VJ858_02085 [Acidimicrobiia bacterium]|nr:hypothetical protein [Acidimicrobiia bacterium]
MRRVITLRLAGLGMAGILTLTAGGAVAVFSAGGPGESVTPMDGADLLVGLVQSQESILWTSLAGPVSTVKTLGWPSSDGTHDLGGALVLETPANPSAGAVNIGEKPLSVAFSFEN